MYDQGRIQDFQMGGRGAQKIVLVARGSARVFASLREGKMPRNCHRQPRKSRKSLKS